MPIVIILPDQAGRIISTFRTLFKTPNRHIHQSTMDPSETAAIVTSTSARVTADGTYATQSALSTTTSRTEGSDLYLLQHIIRLCD